MSDHEAEARKVAEEIKDCLRVDGDGWSIVRWLDDRMKAAILAFAQRVRDPLEAQLRTAVEGGRLVMEDREALRAQLAEAVEREKAAEARVEELSRELEQAVSVLIHHGCACDWNEPSTEPRTVPAQQPCVFHADMQSRVEELEKALARTTAEAIATALTPDEAKAALGALARPEARTPEPKR